MPQILVPVDLSTNSKNAYAYALGLATRLQLDVKLLHVYNQSFVPNEPMHFDGSDSLEESDERRLKQFARPHPTDPDYLRLKVPQNVTITYDTVINLSAAAGIRAAAAEDDVEMIVMGTSNKTGIFVNWLGSTASTISETASKPVMLVPPTATFTDYRTIVVANHYETTDTEVMEQVSTLGKLFNATLHFAHIIHPTDHFPYQFVARSISDQLTTGPDKELAFKVANLKNDSVAEGLEQYAEKQEADLMVVVNRKRSTWNALLRSSLTQQMAMTTKIPLLIIHSEAFYQHRSTV